MKPGIYDISNKEYHNGKGLSNSGLKEFMRSPLHYWHAYLNPEKEPIKKTADKIFGDATHAYVLEPDRFEKEYFVHEKINQSTKKGKEDWLKILYKAGARELITNEDFQKIKTIKEKLYQINELKSLLVEPSEDRQIEKSIYWEDPDTKVLCKSRPDILLLNGGIICDLKTTDDINSFQYSIKKYKYHVQAAMMREAVLRQFNKEIEYFVFIATEKKPPYLMAIYMLSSLSMDEGLNIFKSQLPAFKECLESNFWPSYKLEEICISKKEKSYE